MKSAKRKVNRRETSSHPKAFALLCLQRDSGRCFKFLVRSLFPQSIFLFTRYIRMYYELLCIELSKVYKLP